MGLDGPQSQSGLSDEQKKKSLALAWIRIQDRSVHGLVTINAALFTGIKPVSKKKKKDGWYGLTLILLTWRIG